MTDPPIATTAEAHEATALPQVHEVHADPTRKPQDTEGLPRALQSPAEGKSPARWAYERLILYIKNFEDRLDADHEVAMGFAGDTTGVLRIEGLGYFDPDLITFYGSDATGTRTQLIQHVTQLSVMLRALPRPRDKAEPVRIGFRLASDLEDAAE
ncbi:MAG: hypothetical protein HLUCCA08_00715 [Rhodobacteraceae bacterium HLUCCA08]|nr:MAG: hypothetical protein HLUCCA08_00715 [Rhodobacteraceae bacterium HLUCCA08]